MTSNIHISWDGPFMAQEQLGIRHFLERAVMAGDFHVCNCGIMLLMVSRGETPTSFSAQLACGCGIQSGEKDISIPAA